MTAFTRILVGAALTAGVTGCMNLDAPTQCAAGACDASTDAEYAQKSARILRDNAAAQAFYAKLGFALDEAVAMGKRLERDEP